MIVGLGTDPDPFQSVLYSAEYNAYEDEGRLPLFRLFEEDLGSECSWGLLGYI